ncbi:MAG: hypothetical protein AMJ90_09360 [candidate division Zixibacteria bacterium SM23_73_2]|nr:MAG: hypothetical protein AMJ90_09360 [candidate division Zixibacteria bacterium SM23_73_2]
MKRICFLADAVSTHTKRWVNYFVERGYECHLISLEGGQGIESKLYLLNSRVSLPGLKFVFVRKETEKITEEIKPDLINAHFVISYGFLGAMIEKRPLVVSCWGSDILLSPHKSFLHRLRVKYVLKRADLFTSDGFNLTKALVDLGVSQEKIITSPMGVSKDLLSLEKKKDKDSIIVLSLRRLEPIYDLKTLIYAIPLVLKQTQKPMKFVIVGEGSERVRLMKLAHTLDVEDYVVFKGRVTQEKLLILFESSDIYVSTSLSDSTSVSLLEAMAAGLTPVVTDIPGNRDWIKDEKNGFLFSPDDHKDLAQKIIRLTGNLGKYDFFKKENKTIIEKKALWEENMRLVENRFLQLCQ